MSAAALQAPPTAAAPGCGWLPAGTVYGTLLNFRREWDLWAPRVAEPPYKAAPQAPVLYVKTANTFAAQGAAVAVPGPLWLGPTLGLVVADSVPNSALAQSTSAPAATNSVVNGVVLGGVPIGAVVLADDLSLPHDSYYRPAIRFRNRDGFLVCGQPVPAADVDLAALRIEAWLNGARVQTIDLATLVRSAATLLADVNAFMTLQPGDVLLLGTDCLPDGSRPLGQPGDRVEIRADGLPILQHTLVDEDTSDAGPPQGAKAPSGGSAVHEVKSVAAMSTS